MIASSMDKTRKKPSDSWSSTTKETSRTRFVIICIISRYPTDIWQHRYVQNTATEMGGKAADLLEKLGYKEIGSADDILKHFVGDYLHNF